ncbi:MAG: hypothetical protein RSF29_03310 [Algoriella sp.]
MKRIDQFEAKTRFGDYELIAYQQTTNNQVHFALKKGTWTKDDVVPVRVKSTNSYYDLFSALQNGETPLLEKTMNIINEEKKGVVIFINNIQNSELIEQKLEILKSFSEGKSKSGVLPADEKDHGIGSQIIKDLGIQKINLITRNLEDPHTTQYGLEIVKCSQL